MLAEPSRGGEECSSAGLGDGGGGGGGWPAWVLRGTSDRALVYSNNAIKNLYLMRFSVSRHSGSSTSRSKYIMSTQGSSDDASTL